MVFLEIWYFWKFGIFSGEKKQIKTYYTRTHYTLHIMAAPRYEYLEHAAQVKKCYGMHVGSKALSTEPVFLYDVDASNMTLRENAAYCPAFQKIVAEIIDNAHDNFARGTRHIDVSIDVENGKIVVSNDGSTIAVVKDAELGEYDATLLFSRLCSGSNYTATEANAANQGQNGYGCKLTNMFSSYFSVECRDEVNKLVLKQLWTNGMRETTGPQIKPLKKLGKWTTVVSFIPDNGFFELTPEQLQQQYEFIQTDLVRRACLAPDIVFTFNKKKLVGGKRSLLKYMNLFKDYVQKPTFIDVNDDFALGFGLAEEPLLQSFVNGNFTSRGGTHAVKATNLVATAIRKYFDGKGKKITYPMIKSRLAIFCDFSVQHAKFTSQTKVEFSGVLPLGKYQIGDDVVIKAAKKCGLLAALQEMLLAKQDKQLLSSSSSSKQRSVRVDKLLDATKAGTSRSLECRLFLTEGDSATTMAVSGFSVIKRATNGAFALKGKLLNTIAASKAAVAKNNEIANLVKILGLNYHKTYESEAERKTLRYGHVVVMTDADVDGMHIFSLVAAYFAKFFPKLLEHGFLQRMVTPVIKATRSGVETLEFFDVPSYEKWAATAIDTDNDKLKYYKGLGTSTRQEAVAYFENLNKYLKPVVLNEDIKDTISLLFDSSRTDDRKRWLLEGAADSLDYSTPVQELKTVLNKEVKQYHLASATRALPSYLDGLKESQRKILFTLLSLGKTNKEFKVAQLAAVVAEKSMYLHGETSLTGAIVKMAQSFPASNNLPLLQELGQFGSRLQNGADAASGRYLFTRLHGYVHHLFNAKDLPLLETLTEESAEIEPRHYVPLLPLLLINGANGIATGFRCLVPQFSVADIVAQIEARLHGTTPLGIIPHCNGWGGSVDVGANGWIYTGKYEVNGNVVIITAIPTSRSIENYTNFLNSLLEKKKIVSFTDEHFSENSPCFKIKFDTPPEDIPKTLQLSATVSNKCLNVLDENGNVKNYRHIREILDDFFALRIDFYKRRRLHQLEQLRTERKRQEQLYCFVHAIHNDKIDFKTLSRTELHKVVCDVVGVDGKRARELLALSFSMLCRTDTEAIQNKMANILGNIVKLEEASAHSLYSADLAVLKESLGLPEQKRPATAAPAASSKKKAKLTQ